MQLLRGRRARRQEKIQEEIRDALNAIRPILRINECALKLVSFDAESGTVLLEMHGECPDCQVSVETFLQGIETKLKLRVAEIRTVRVTAA